jgi:hypothetical protein
VSLTGGRLNSQGYVPCGACGVNTDVGARDGRDPKNTGSERKVGLRHLFLRIWGENSKTLVHYSKCKSRTQTWEPGQSLTKTPNSERSGRRGHARPVSCVSGTLPPSILPALRSRSFSSFLKFMVKPKVDVRQMREMSTGDTGPSAAQGDPLCDGSRPWEPLSPRHVHRASGDTRQT